MQIYERHLRLVQITYMVHSVPTLIMVSGSVPLATSVAQRRAREESCSVARPPSSLNLSHRQNCKRVGGWVKNVPLLESRVSLNHIV